ncbi:hypothetical protein R6Q57_030200 [Mikania cordata]
MVAKVQDPHPQPPHHCRPNRILSESQHRFSYGVNTMQLYWNIRISDLEACGGLMSPSYDCFEKLTSIFSVADMMSMFDRNTLHAKRHI